MSFNQHQVFKPIVDVEHLLLKGFTDPNFALGMLTICVLASVVKIRSLTLPLLKLAIAYVLAFALVLTAMHGHEDLLNFTSLKHLKSTTKAALWATAICFFAGLVTPKKVRTGPKA